jgi:high-affinity nickel permease
MSVDIGLALVGTGIGLGLRHGIDWDHIAAIGDVTASQQSRVRSIALGTLYALGHAAVVIVLGLLAIWAGSTLPDSIDPIMERVVGVTLILLGLWIAISLVRNRGRLVLRSRWMLVADIIEVGIRKVRRSLGHQQVEPVAGKRNYGVASSATVGAVHGIGAETGSQALLLASAAGATSATAGSLLLVSFAIGLIASNLLITLASTFGWAGSHSRRIVQTALGVVIASFSLVVGTLFLLQKGDLLPGFFS